MFNCKNCSASQNLYVCDYFSKNPPGIEFNSGKINPYAFFLYFFKLKIYFYKIL